MFTFTNKGKIVNRYKKVVKVGCIFPKIRVYLCEIIEQGYIADD